jgi:hypothetical protein
MVPKWFILNQMNKGQTVTPEFCKVHCNIIVLSVLRGFGLKFLNFDLRFIFGRICKVKCVHEERKSVCVTILNLRILHSVVTVGPSQLSIL